jgi:trehalose-phosphatase
MLRPILALSERHVLDRLARGKTLVALDFDGTLAPITDRPSRARMRPVTARLLAAIARGYPALVVSGRSRADVLSRLGPVPVEVLGNHGAESTTGDRRVERLIARARRDLAHGMQGLTGTWLEDKVYSLALHYRDAPDHRVAKAGLWRAVSRLQGVRVFPGKLVLNVVARGAPDKGIAVEQARRRHACEHVLYVGDDETDEDVFRSKSGGRLVGVRVGCGTGTRATFCLRRQEDVDHLLRVLVRLRQGQTRERPMADAKEPALGGTLEFMRLLWALDHALQKRSKWMATRHGVTGPQRLALRIVGRIPDVSAGQLASTLKVHPSTLTGVLQRLERRALLTRHSDRTDRRRVRLGLTPRGRTVTQASAGSIEDAVTRTLRKAGPKQLAATADLLRALVEALERDLRG